MTTSAAPGPNGNAGWVSSREKRGSPPPDSWTTEGHSPRGVDVAPATVQALPTQPRRPGPLLWTRLQAATPSHQAMTTARAIDAGDTTPCQLLETSLPPGPQRVLDGLTLEPSTIVFSCRGAPCKAARAGGAGSEPRDGPGLLSSRSPRAALPGRSAESSAAQPRGQGRVCRHRPSPGPQLRPLGLRRRVQLCRSVTSTAPSLDSRGFRRL